MTQGLASITVHLTPRWGCVTTWICKYWGGPNISWPDPKLGSCYNPNSHFSGRMTQGLGSITVHLTPRWGCVTTWICKDWWGPNIVDLTPSWGPVTTQIHFSLEEWPKDWVLLQFIWPHVGVVLQPEFVNINGVLIYLTWPQVGVLLQPKYTFLWKNDPRILLYNSSSDPKLGLCYNPNFYILKWF